MYWAGNPSWYPCLPIKRFFFACKPHLKKAEKLRTYLSPSCKWHGILNGLWMSLSWIEMWVDLFWIQMEWACCCCFHSISWWLIHRLFQDNQLDNRVHFLPGGRQWNQPWFAFLYLLWWLWCNSPCFCNLKGSQVKRSSLLLLLIFGYSQVLKMYILQLAKGLCLHQIKTCTVSKWLFGISMSAIGIYP